MNPSPDEIKTFKAMSAHTKRRASSGREIWPVEAIGAKRGGEVQLTVVHRGTGKTVNNLVIDDINLQAGSGWAGSLVVLLCKSHRHRAVDPAGSRGTWEDRMLPVHDDH